MNIIVSCDLNWGIGKGEALLARIPEDMSFFKQTTMGHIVIMGRKTLESLPGQKPLPGRVNIVVTKNKDYKKEGFIITSGIDEAINAAKAYSPKKIFIIGGGSIYREFMPFCDTAYITRLYKSFEADTFFENLDKNPKWEIVRESPFKKYDGMDFRFLTYKKLEK
ncbi:MAG: dihydrofolate reductase [Lachnospiraceae bacterium]|nr:dihydrofolate reductase [Lachnospiraceae bacterium]